MKAPRLLITCEHGGNRVPRSVATQFARHLTAAREALNSHRGWDPGALSLARRFASRLPAPLLFSEVSRLVVELNRSPRHRRLFSEFMADVPRELRQTIVSEHYEPHRAAVLEHARAAARQNRQLIHVSVHTFTPQLGDDVRHADVGLLYDPARRSERTFCNFWLSDLRTAHRDLTVRRNYPYLGKTDGLVTTIRRAVPEPHYLGIELEVNQKHPLAAGARWSRLQVAIVESFCRTLENSRTRQVATL